MKKRLRKKLRRGEFTPARQRIRAERQRQVTVEGWSPTHDDEHVDGALEQAADCYAAPAAERRPRADDPRMPQGWTWPVRYWKPTPADRVRELEKAGALYEAELERLARLQAWMRRRPAGPPPPDTLRGRALAGLARDGQRVRTKQARVEWELNARLRGLV